MKAKADSGLKMDHLIMTLLQLREWQPTVTMDLMVCLGLVLLEDLGRIVGPDWVTLLTKI